MVSMETIDGLTLKSYLYMNKSNTQTILFLHGNAGTLNSRIYKLNKFKELGFNYLALSWRGFSGNEGAPSEEGLIKDALAGLDYLNTLDIEDLKIIVYGESLGTGVGISVAGRRSLICLCSQFENRSKSSTSLLLTNKLAFFSENAKSNY